MGVQAKRVAQVRLGIWVEIFTVLWMVVEAVVSIGAGIAARSTLLTAFGIDSVIELVSGAMLLWRLSVEARGEDTKHIERCGTARRLGGGCRACLVMCVCPGHRRLWASHPIPPGEFSCGYRYLDCRPGGDADAGDHETAHRGTHW